MNETYMSWPLLDRFAIVLAIGALIACLYSLHRKLDQILRALENFNRKS